MRSLVIILVSIVPLMTAMSIYKPEPITTSINLSEEPEETTWKLYEVTPSEREQVELLRTMIAGYSMEIFINRELREDETVFVLMKTTKEGDILKNFRDANILHKKQQNRFASKNQENVFGVYGGDVSLPSDE